MRHPAGGSRKQELKMANGDQMPNTRILTIVVALVLALNGGLWWAVSQQSKSIDALTTLIYSKMDDRYRRWEANAAHTAIIQRMVQAEKHADHMEAKIDKHQMDDDKIHK
jgi:hypothetical protein